jgi:hypothetical protein
MTEAPLRLAGLDRALVFGFWLAYVLVGAQTTIATDTARDLIAAWDIVQGTHYPLRGPELYSTWTLGPIWYYLLALPLWLTHSAAAAAWMVAVLAGLKFPLAWRLGAEFGGAPLARSALLAIAVPGWWMFEWLVTSHTNLAAPLLIGYALWLLRWARGAGVGSLLLAGLLFSLSLHAHPTSLFWVWLALPAMWSRHQSAMRIPAVHVAGALLMFALPFLPMLIDEALHGWPLLDGTRAFVASRDGPSLIWRFLPFVRDLFGVQRVGSIGQFLGVSTAIQIGMLSLLGLMVGLALLGLLQRQALFLAPRRMVAASIIGASLFLLWLRPEVPYWMVYSQAPGVAAALALGWQIPAERQARFLRILTVVVVGMFLCVVAVRWHEAAEAWVRVPYRVVGLYADPGKQVDTEIPNPAYPVAGLESWVRWLCGQPNRLSLHGDGAAMEAMTQGTLHALNCADDRHWEIGGNQGEAVALYPLKALDALSLAPMQQFGGMGRLTVDAVLRAAEPQPDDLVRAYPPWPLTQQAAAEFTVPIDTATPKLIAVSNLRIVFNGLEGPQVRVGGVPQLPITRTAATWFYRIPAGSEAIMTVRTGDPRWIEVVALADVVNR